MISYTLRDYLELTQFINLNELAVLREPNVPYLLTNTNKYNRHDKIFRKLLANKIEMKKLLKEESEIEQLLDNNELERYDTKYITKGYEDRQADIVYKLKEKEIFFLIEHQTKVDKLMAFRMLEYSLEIIRARMKELKGKIEKVGLPSVIPIVLYTGKEKWTAKRNFEEMQVDFECFTGIKSITGYNLIDIRDKEKAKKDDSIISKMSVLERLNETEEILQTLYEFAETMNSQEAKEDLAQMVQYLFEDKIEETKLKEAITYLKKSKTGGEGIMHVHEVLRRDEEKAKKKAMNEGKMNGLIQVAKNMLKEKLDVDFISKVTGLSKEQFLEK